MNPNYVIRRATTADAAIIVQHRRRMFEEMGDREYIESERIDACYYDWVRERLADGRYAGWLMTNNGSVVGGVGVEARERAPHPVDLTTRYAYVMNVYVDPAHRRQGIARDLLTAALDWCAREGLCIISLHASEKGRPLYESLGFVATNEMRLVRRDVP